MTPLTPVESSTFLVSCSTYICFAAPPSAPPELERGLVIGTAEEAGRGAEAATTATSAALAERRGAKCGSACRHTTGRKAGVSVGAALALRRGAVALVAVVRLRRDDVPVRPDEHVTLHCPPRAGEHLALRVSVARSEDIALGIPPPGGQGIAFEHPRVGGAEVALRDPAARRQGIVACAALAPVVESDSTPREAYVPFAASVRMSRLPDRPPAPSIVSCSVTPSRVAKRSRSPTPSAPTYFAWDADAPVVASESTPREVYVPVAASVCTSRVADSPSVPTMTSCSLTPSRVVKRSRSPSPSAPTTPREVYVPLSSTCASRLPDTPSRVAIASRSTYSLLTARSRPPFRASSRATKPARSAFAPRVAPAVEAVSRCAPKGYAPGPGPSLGVVYRDESAVPPPPPLLLAIQVLIADRLILHHAPVASVPLVPRGRDAAHARRLAVAAGVHDRQVF
ncbi:uncharacterized protein LOC62_04G006441 [Vanrija pseudolonga]|uniref:Uncharacterized protein n=1 Tax=Vanrija pseudolonga TaxID=143232 RepID=A0AAF1BJP2_9TREE|nr:hypothetical protein LOC62_04G006441 [Vanrija pseudolonga]